MNERAPRASGLGGRRAWEEGRRRLAAASLLAVVMGGALLLPGGLGGSRAAGAAEVPAHGVQGYQAGQYDWVAPDGVTSVQVELWGGGGGGGCAAGADGKGGGGGGAGGYLRTLVTVVPGDPYSLVVSDVAAGCTAAHPARNGGRTVLLSGKSVLAGAFGGRAGGDGAATHQGQGGFGGNTSIAAFAVTFSGYPGRNAFGHGYSGDGGPSTMGSVGRDIGSGGEGAGRDYLPWALDSVLRHPAGFGARGFAILTW
jgi:hypothetical protein